MQFPHATRLRTFHRDVAGLRPSRGHSVLAQLFSSIHELTGALTQGRRRVRLGFTGSGPKMANPRKTTTTMSITGLGIHGSVIAVEHLRLCCISDTDPVIICAYSDTNKYGSNVVDDWRFSDRCHPWRMRKLLLLRPRLWANATRQHPPGPNGS